MRKLGVSPGCISDSSELGLHFLNKKSMQDIDKWQLLAPSANLCRVILVGIPLKDPGKYTCLCWEYS